jgi:hypothetical protein
VRWQRFADVFPWRIAALLVLLLGLQSLFFWTWFRWEVSPLQRYYFLAYFNCTEDAKHAGMQTQIQWLFKTAPGRKRLPIIAADIVSGGNGNVPVQLSLTAIDQGWTGIERSSPKWVNSEELEDFLQEDFYDQRGFWQLLAEPLLGGCVLLLVPVFLVLVIREELALEWSRLRRAVTGPAPVSDYSWGSPADRRGITRWLNSRIDIGKWLRKLGPTRADPAPDKRRKADANRGPIIDDIGSVQSSLPDRVPHPDSGAQAVGRTISETPYERSSSNPRKRPAKRRSIFPGRAGVRGSNRKPKPWDESQWID